MRNFESHLKFNHINTEDIIKEEKTKFFWFDHLDIQDWLFVDTWEVYVLLKVGV